jgi:hypothetical protein
MTRAALVALASCLLVPASAGTSTAPPPVALTASPARVVLAGADQAEVRVVNAGRTPVVVSATRAGFALDLRGRPRIVRPGARTAVPWLTIRPSRLALRPGGSATVAVSSRPPPGAEPGDHDALVLLTTLAPAANRIAVRMRLGVVVVVRAPGTVVRRLDPLSLRVRKARGRRVLELLLANRGNVTERLTRERVRVWLERPGKARVRLRPDPRDLRPRTRGIVRVPYRGRWRGRVTVRLELVVEPGVVVRRAYRLRL